MKSEIEQEIDSYIAKYMKPWMTEGSYIRRKSNGDWGQVTSVGVFALRLQWSDESGSGSGSSLAAFMGATESLPLIQIALLFEAYDPKWAENRPVRAVDNPPV